MTDKFDSGKHHPRQNNVVYTTTDNPVTVYGQQCVKRPAVSATLLKLLKEKATQCKDQIQGFSKHYT